MERRVGVVRRRKTHDRFVGNSSSMTAAQRACNVGRPELDKLDAVGGDKHFRHLFREVCRAYII